MLQQKDGKGRWWQNSWGFNKQKQLVSKRFLGFGLFWTKMLILFTLPETNVSAEKASLKMICLLGRWDMLVPCRVTKTSGTIKFDKVLLQANPKDTCPDILKHMPMAQKRQRNEIPTRLPGTITITTAWQSTIKPQHVYMYIYGGFLKWWVSPTTIGFPTKNDHFGVFWITHIAISLRCVYVYIWGFPKMVGFPNNHWFSY